MAEATHHFLRAWCFNGLASLASTQKVRVRIPVHACLLYRTRLIHRGMHHYVYEVRNIINGHVYVGKHTTDDLNDGYMGSGTALSAAIVEFGLESFRKTVLSHHASEDDAFEEEALIVTMEFVERDDTYNLRTGGRGDRWGSEAQRKGGSRTLKKLWANDDWREGQRKRASVRFKKMHEDGIVKPYDLSGRRHTDESKRKIGKANSQHQKGSGNSQFGKVWMYSLEEKRSTKVSKDRVDEMIQQGWTRGRKMNFSEIQ